MALISESGFDLFVEKVNGVEVLINDDNSYNFSVASLSISKNKLQVIEYKSFRDSGIADLAIDKTIPLCVAFSGKWVISRKIQIDKTDTDQILLGKVLPNATLSEFFLQRYDIDEGNAFISIIRKKVIDDFLLASKENGLNIILCSLGPFSVQSIFPLLLNHDAQRFYSDLNTGNYNVAIEKNKIVNISAPEILESKDLDLSGVACASEYLLAFSAAFSHFTKAEHSTIHIPQIDEALSEYGFKRKFRNTGIIYAFVIFGLLVVNFALFSYWNDRNKDMQARVAISSSDVALVDKLKKQIIDRESFFSQNGITASTRNSFYADRIAASLPPSLSLTQLNINPVKIDDETKKMSYAPLIIKVRGSARYSIEVNEWMKELKKMSWVSEATLTNYKQESSGTSGIFDIEMKIK